MRSAVVVDDLFLLHETARPEVERWRADAEGAELLAQHGGFGRPEQRWIHQRRVRFEPDLRRWTIEDCLRSEGIAGAAPPAESVWLRYPLRPGTACEQVAEEAAWPDELAALAAVATEGDQGTAIFLLELTEPDQRRFWILLELPPGSQVEMHKGLYSPRYGVAEPCRVVTAVMSSATELRARSTLQAPVAAPDSSPSSG